MKFVVRAAFAACVLVASPMSAWADPLTFAGLKTMVENMGYTPNMLSSGDENPKFEATVTTAAFNVPIGFEITKSTRYIWCTASLGPSKVDPETALAMLKKIPDIQPTTFWITSKNTLVMGIAIDNRDVTPAHIKFIMEKLAGDVGSTSELWQ